jgi:PAS domain S-box-containing protein
MKKKQESSIDGYLNGDKIINQDIAVLLGELQVAQLELEMQNDELLVSSQLLETERAKFEQLFNFAPVGYFILDRLGIINEFNQAAANLLAIPRTDVLNKRFQSFVAPENWERFYLFLHSLQIKNTKQSIDIKLQLKNGAVYYTRVEGIRTKSKYSEELLYYITVTDITENRLIQQNLLATAQRLEMTLGATGTGTWSLDLESRKIYMDDFCCSLFEINSSAFDGSFKSFIQLVYASDREKIWQDLSSSINNNVPINLEFRVITAANQIKVFSLKGKEVKMNSFNKLYVGILVDITLQQSLAEQERQSQKDTQRLILSTTLNAQEKERQKISMALHDSVCQLLYGVKLHMQTIQKRNDLKNEFKNIDSLLDQAIAETRALSYDLTPSVLRDFGFTAGVKEIAHRFSTANFKINTRVKKDADLLEPNLQLFVFRIMQELLNNCIKHSKATNANIEVRIEGRIITLSIEDNGKGFGMVLEQALANGSGLRGIKNRIVMLEGLMDIDSSATGSRITVKLKTDLELSEDIP